MDELKKDVLEEVSGGAGTAKKHVQIVNCQNRVNVRKLPDKESTKVGYAYLGDRYVFYKWVGNWAEIQYGSTVAYIFGDFIRVV